jgi:virginiamycin B lyase
MWFTEPGIQKIGRITLAGNISQFPAAGGGLGTGRNPTGIVAGPDGNLWFTEKGNGGMGKIGWMTPAGVVVNEKDVGGSTAPTGITVGPDGALWFTEQGTNRIGRITAAGTVTDHFPTTGSGPTSITLGPDGNFWFTEAGSGTIGRMTPAGVATSFPLPTAGSNPSGLVVGADGALWFAEQAVNQIGRITTAGVVGEYPASTRAMGPEALALGADGNVWYAKSTNPGAFGRIDPTGGNEDWPLQASGMIVKGIAAGPDGNLWLTSSAQDKVMRVIPGPGVEPAVSAAAGTTSATLRGVVRPANKATTYYFEYGTTSDYGASTDDAGAGSGTGPVSAEAVASGLSPQTTYHYRLVARNATETTRGSDRTFTTGSNPIELPPALPNLAAPEPTPVLGQTVVATVAQGVVKVKLTGAKSFVPLSGKVSVPTGSELDTTKARFSLVTRSTRGGIRSTGTFNGGRFKVKQSKTGKGMTDLYLSGPKPGRCSAPNRASASKAAKKRKRSLWGKDNEGRFRTHGADQRRHRARTRWLTQDRCDGTLTRVTEGAVVVRELQPQGQHGRARGAQLPGAAQ